MKSSNQDQSTPSSAWNEFRLGLIQPSAGAVALAVALNIGLLIGLMVGINASFFQSDLPLYFATRGLDLDAFVTIDAMRLSQRQSELPLVVVLGASATLDSVDGELLEHSLNEIVPQHHDVFKLTTGGQDLWDSMMVAGMIPPESTGVVVIATPPSRFIQRRDTLEGLAKSPRIGVPSPWLDEELEHYDIDVPRRTGYYILDNNRFLFARVPFMVRNLVNGPIPRIDMPTLGTDPLNAAAWSERTPPLIERLTAWDTTIEQNLEVLARLITHVRESSGLTVLLVEPPVNPRFLREPGIDALFERHRARLNSFAVEQGCTYIDVANEIGVIEDDFRDWFHFRNEDTARRYTSRLAEHLAELETGGTP